MTKEESRAVRFALDLVDRLGAEYGFDPAELVNPRTGRPFGAFIARMRRTMLRVDAYCLDEPSGLDDPEVTGFAIRGGSLNYGHPSRGQPEVLRLTGLPRASRFPDAVLVHDGDRLELRFCGTGDTRTMEIPLWTLEGQDVEAVELWLLTELQRRGYSVTLER